MRRSGRVVLAAFVAGFVSFGGGPLVKAADPYKGKTITIVVGYGPGFAFDNYARLMARYMPNHIPGAPNIIVQNMPGAGSLKATGYIANAAPRDGTVIGLLHPVNTIEPLLDPGRSKFDPRKFSWIGSINKEIGTCAFWSGKLNALEDLRGREVVMGSQGPSNSSGVDAKALRTMLGFNFKIVAGYPGLADIRMAAEGGELDGQCGLLVSILKSDLWSDFQSGKVKVLIQVGVDKHPELPDTPNAFDLVKSDEDRQLLRLISGPWSYGRPVGAPPNTPADRLATLRAAFDATMGDSGFLADAKKLNLEVQPISGDHVAKLIDDIYETPQSVVERGRQMFGMGDR